MDQPDAVRSHNREAWDAEVERRNRWTVPVDHQAIEAARRGPLPPARGGRRWSALSARYLPLLEPFILKDSV